VAQRLGRGIALRFHDRDRGRVVSSTHRPHFTLGKVPEHILQEADGNYVQWNSMCAVGYYLCRIQLERKFVFDSL